MKLQRESARSSFISKYGISSSSLPFPGCCVSISIIHKQSQKRNSEDKGKRFTKRSITNEATMKLVTLLMTLVVILHVMNDVIGITNQEFYDLIKDHTEDIKTLDVRKDSDDDIITLPGNENDELDVQYLLAKMVDPLQGTGKFRLPDKRRRPMVGWFRIIHHVIHGVRHLWRRHRYGNLGKGYFPGKTMTPCHVRFDHGYKINLSQGPMKFRLNGCLKFAFQKFGHDGLLLSVTNNGKPFFKKYVSLSPEPSDCVAVAQLGQLADVCLETYQPDPDEDLTCVRLTSNLSVKTKKVRVHYDLWCGDDSDQHAQEGPAELSDLQAAVEDTNTGQFMDIPAYDLPSLYRELQYGDDNDDEYNADVADEDDVDEDADITDESNERENERVDLRFEEYPTK